MVGPSLVRTQAARNAPLIRVEKGQRTSRSVLHIGSHVGELANSGAGAAKGMLGCIMAAAPASPRSRLSARRPGRAGWGGRRPPRRTGGSPPSRPASGAGTLARRAPARAKATSCGRRSGASACGSRATPTAAESGARGQAPRWRAGGGAKKLTDGQADPRLPSIAAERCRHPAAHRRRDTAQLCQCRMFTIL